MKATTRIRLSKDSDLPFIYEWLEEEYARGIENLFNNWELTKEVHDEGKLYVYANERGHPIAYLWDNFGILNVKQTERHRGIGRKLVKFGLKKLFVQNKKYVEIQCAPNSSVPFWESLGFERFQKKHQNDFDVYMRKLLRE